MTMTLDAIEMAAEDAQAAFEEYRDSVRESPNAEDEQIMRGYRELARGHRVIDLPKTIRAGGTHAVEFGTDTWRVPHLAACRADARICFTRGVDHQGSVQFTADKRALEIASNNRKDRFVLDDGTFDPPATFGTWRSLRAIVPNVPPRFRPRHALSGYTILWEAEWAPDPQPPIDPALLKHIGGDLYALVAVWDLTAIERAVLSARA